MNITEFSFTPRCPQCQAPVAYLVAPHEGDCKLAKGKKPRRGTVEWEVMHGYAYYPSLYGRSPWSRWYIFDHLLIRSGTGLDWINGGRHAFGVFKKRERKGPWREYKPSKLDEIGYDVGSFARWREVLDAESKDETCDWYSPEQYKRDNSMPQYFGDLHRNYAPVFNLPDNIKPEWFQACIDLMTMLYIQPATYSSAPDGVVRTNPQGNIKAIQELEVYLYRFLETHPTLAAAVSAG